MADFRSLAKKMMNGSSSGVTSMVGGGQGSNITGIVPAIVTNNQDPEDRYRVKVEYIQMEGKVESDWIRIATPMGGAGEMGMFVLPEVGNEVMVSGISGDPEQLLIVGHCWNATDKSVRSVDISPDDVNEPTSNNAQGGLNDFRFIRSRMGHHLVFKDREGEGAISIRTKKSNELFLDDTDGAEKIQLYDMDRSQWLEIDVPNKIITMQTDTGEILIKAKTKITMDCEDLIVKASKSITVESGTTSDWTAKGALNWETKAAATYKSSSGTTVQGSTIDLNP